MPAVLGIDAAWSERNPSGVALIRQNEGGVWEFVAVAPSYDAFIGIANNQEVQRDITPTGGVPEPERLLEAADNLLDGEPVTVVAVDIPLSLDEPITRRRACDQAISEAFGAMGCSPHSPNASRPGEISYQLRASLDHLGYPLAVNNPGGLIAPATIEVYPHPALLCLLNRGYRVLYKVRKFRAAQVDELLAEFQRIRLGLDGEILGIPSCFPPAPPYAGLFTHLKRYEDALDALVCAWVGVRYLAGHAIAYGDHNAAIWVPCCRANPLPENNRG